MKNSLIIITGAASGIGAGIAKIFSEEGYSLGLLSKNLPKNNIMSEKNSVFIETDVTNIASVKNAIQIAEEKFGPTHCLINCAGFAKGGEFLELEHADHELMLDVNIKGVMNCIEIILPGMQKRNAGSIINISSLSDRQSTPGAAIYAASKAAVKNLSESLRAENARYNIRICNIAPAKIRTPMLMESGHMDEQTISVEELVKIILWVYKQPDNVCIRDMVIAPTNYIE